MEKLKSELIQTGHNIQRMFEDKAIKRTAYAVLKCRNELALAELDKIINIEKTSCDHDGDYTKCNVVHMFKCKYCKLNNK